MSQKRILIISRSFYPTVSPRSFRATELAKEFAREGHKVKVLTSFKSDVNYEKLSASLGVEFKNYGKESFRTIRYNGNGLLRIIVMMVNRLLLMLFEFPDIQIMRLVARALKEENGHDLLISVAVPYPVHWGVAWARNSRHQIATTWVADCGDPYMGDRIDTVRKLFYFKYVEKWFSRKADYITVPTLESIEGYYEEFRNKIKIIPQGFNFNEVKYSGKAFNEPIRFAYAGNIIPVNRDPRPFLDFLSTLSCDFIFTIFTRKVDLIKGFKSKLGAKLEIRDYIPRDELLPLLASMDFLVNFDNNTTIHTPSKLIDYAIVKRPILNIKSDLDKSLISSFLSRDYTRAYKIDNMEQYNIINIAKNFLDLFGCC